MLLARSYRKRTHLLFQQHALQLIILLAFARGFASPIPLPIAYPSGSHLPLYEINK